MSSNNVGYDAFDISSSGGASNNIPPLDAFVLSETNDRNNCVTNRTIPSPMDWTESDILSNGPLNNQNGKAHLATDPSAVTPSQLDIVSTNANQLSASKSPNLLAFQDVSRTSSTNIHQFAFISAHLDLKYANLPVEPAEPRQVKFRQSPSTNQEKVNLNYIRNLGF